MAARKEDVANEKETPSTKTQVEVVKMDDGRSVEFAGKRKMLKDSIFSDDGSVKVIRFDFRNGHTFDFVPPDELKARAEAHGWEQKLGDETAGESDVDDMQLAVEELAERLQKGEWTVKREGGGMSGTSILLKALVEYSGRTVEDLKAFLKGKTAAEKLGLRTDNKKRPGKPETLKTIVDRLEAEKAAKAAHIDTDALLEDGGILA
jgi:hypothetical protein